MTQPIFLIGCDPELFLLSRETGQPVTAHGLIPGDKKTPHKVEAGAIQVDGMAVEFNIDPVPFEDYKKFQENIQTVLGSLRTVLNRPDLRLFAESATVIFDKEYYDSVPKEAKELGCDPDFCAYSEDIFQPNDRPNGDSGLRSAAGHIHVGWGKDIPVEHPEHMEICRAFIRNMDCFVGIGMTIIDPNGERRKLYGKAGAFRPKSYGVEYRTPSNRWLLTPAYTRFIHSLTAACIRDMKTGKPMFDRMTKAGVDVRSIINSGDAALATKVLAEFIKVAVPAAPVAAAPKPAEAEPTATVKKAKKAA